MGKQSYWMKANSIVKDYNITTALYTSGNSRKNRFRELVIKYLPDEDFIKITPANHNDYFSLACPVCKEKLFGRLSEWPYYEQLGDERIILCRKCSQIKNYRYKKLSENKPESEVV